MENNEFKSSLKYPKTYTDPNQQKLHDKLMNVLDEYEKNTSYDNREFLCYLTSAIYLTYRELYPRLSIYIPFRTKSDSSCIKNIEKELSRYVNNDNRPNEFDISPIIKDISGIKIVLNDINYSLPATPQYEELLNDPEIANLATISNESVHFADSVDQYLRSPIHNGKQYYELKKNLLKQIIKITPEEFTDERKPKASFSKLYEDAKNEYDYFLENDNFPTIISVDELTTLTNLSNDLRSRAYDQLHFAILNKTLPIVLESPLIKNVLKTSAKFEKESKKPNGFQARYDTLNTPFGPVEVQSQSNKAYYTSTKGSSYHSGMAGKNIDIKEFFELVDKNDEHDLSYYLDVLDNISADKAIISPYELPDFKTEEEKEEYMKTPKGKAFLESEKYREMMKHIKIKDKILVLPKVLPPEIYNEEGNAIPTKLQEWIDSCEKKPIFNTDEYLLSVALSLSPYMNVCSSRTHFFYNSWHPS